MKNRKERLNIISDLLRYNVIGSQEELLEKLLDENIQITQATLSRDLRTLKVSKTPLSNGLYKYALPAKSHIIPTELKLHNFTTNGAIISAEMSGNLTVLKTKPGYASAIALDIDNHKAEEILGTIAGDDTILIIPRDGINKEKIIGTIMHIFDK